MPKDYAKNMSLIGLQFLKSPLYTSVFLMRFSFGLVLFTLPIYLPRHEFSNFAVGIVAAAYPITETIAGPIVGVLADRLGRRRWVWLGLCVSTIALFAFTLDRSILYLVIVHAIQGVAAAMIVVSSLTMVTDVSTVATRGREMGIYDFANLGGYMLGIFTAGVLGFHSLLTPFYLGSILAGIAAVYAFFKLKEKSGRKVGSALSPIQTLILLFSNRRAAAMFPIWLSVTTFIGIALTFGPRQGPSPMVTSWILGGAVLILAFTQPYFGQLSDKYGRDRLMMIGMLSLIGLFVTVITVFRRRFEIIYMVPFFAVFGIGSLAFAPAALASLGDFAPERGRGTTMGVYSIVISLGTIIGPLLGGYLIDTYGLPSLFYAGLIILIVALGVAILIAGPGFSRPRSTVRK